MIKLKDKDFYVSPEKVLEHIYAYMHDIAAAHCSNVDQEQS